MSPFQAMLAESQRLEAKGETAAALDVVYDTLDDWCWDSRWADLDEALATPAATLSVRLILAILINTRAAKQHLKNYDSFWAKAHADFLRRGKPADKLLRGLQHESNFWKYLSA